jgi:zinc transport system substrate-binding protein
MLLTASCGSGSQDKPAAGADKPVQIVVAFYPFQFLAEQIAGRHAVVSNLTQPGAEPHDLELTPKQVGSVSDADLVVYERGFQAAVDEAVHQSGQANVLDTATVVPLQDLGTRAEDSGQHYLDPHVWLDPNNMAKIAGALVDRLSDIDPANRASYAENGARLSADLSKLDGRFRNGLASCQRTHFVTQHAAFGYLARRYGLTQVSIEGLSPDSEPSPARIAAVQREVRRYHATTIFYETLVSPAVAKSIAGDLRLKTDVLDPVEGITPQSKGQDYLAVMTANLASLRTANGCR